MEDYPENLFYDTIEGHYLRKEPCKQSSFIPWVVKQLEACVTDINCYKKFQGDPSELNIQNKYLDAFLCGQVLTSRNKNQILEPIKHAITKSILIKVLRLRSPYDLVRCQMPWIGPPELLSDLYSNFKDNHCINDCTEEAFRSLFIYPGSIITNEAIRQFWIKADKDYAVALKVIAAVYCIPDPPYKQGTYILRNKRGGEFTGLSKKAKQVFDYGTIDQDVYKALSDFLLKVPKNLRNDFTLQKPESQEVA